tara:strand:- start:1609 stop:2265 length:657 start_codon:yes stop_codon:yes gene_type:complete
MKVEITYPDNLNEISLGQYQRYLRVTENIDGEFLYQRTVEVLCNIPFERVTYLKRKDVKFIAEHLHNLINSEVEFKHRFKIKNQEFGFIPNLEEISTGEYADLTAYLGKPEEMHKAMAVLFRPITKKVKDKYEICEYKGTKEFSDLMQYMPLGIALGSLVFFLNLANDLKDAIQHSIRQEAIQIISERFPALAKNGGFTKISTPSLKAMLEDLTKSVS